MAQEGTNDPHSSVGCPEEWKESENDDEDGDGDVDSFGRSGQIAGNIGNGGKERA